MSDLAANAALEILKKIRGILEELKDPKFNGFGTADLGLLAQEKVDIDLGEGSSLVISVYTARRKK